VAGGKEQGARGKEQGARGKEQGARGCFNYYQPSKTALMILPEDASFDLPYAVAGTTYAQL